MNNQALAGATPGRNRRRATIAARERLGRQIGRRLRITSPPHHVTQNLPHVSLVKAPEVLRLTARQQILIGELIADHVVPTISRLEPELVSFHLAVLLVGDE